MSEDSNYQQRLGAAFWNLCMLSALPLLDGYFLAFLTSDSWKDWGQALTFGLTAFSGGGCVYAASQLRGTFSQRIGQVVGVYVGLAALALTVSFARPLFIKLLPANLHLFTAMFILGLGLSHSGVPWLRRIAERFGLRHAFTLMAIASLLQGLFNKDLTLQSLSAELSLDLAPLPALALSLSSGLGLTAVGVVLRMLLTEATGQQPLQIGAGVSLILMGLNLLGAGFPSGAVIGPLALGCLWVMIHATTQGLSRSLRA